FSEANNLDNVYSTYNIPAASQNDARIFLTATNDGGNEELFKVSKGYGVGVGSEIYESASGVLNIKTKTLALHGMQTSTSSSIGGISMPASCAGFITVNISGGNFKIPYFNM